MPQSIPNRSNQESTSASPPTFQSLCRDSVIEVLPDPAPRTSIRSLESVGESLRVCSRPLRVSTWESSGTNSLGPSLSSVQSQGSAKRKEKREIKNEKRLRQKKSQERAKEVIEMHKRQIEAHRETKRKRNEVARLELKEGRKELKTSGVGWRRKQVEKRSGNSADDDNDELKRARRKSFARASSVAFLE